MITYEHISSTIKRYRKSRKLSQTQLGELIGLRQKDISAIENQKSGVDSISKISLIADYLNIPYPELFLDDNLIRENKEVISIDTELGPVELVKVKGEGIYKIRYKNNHSEDVSSNKKGDHDMSREPKNNKIPIEPTNKIEYISDIIPPVRTEDVRHILSKNICMKHHKNTLLIGSAGCGKSYCYVKPNVEIGKDNYVIVTMNPDMLSSVLNSKGYDVIFIGEPSTICKEQEPLNIFNNINDEQDIVSFIRCLLDNDDNGEFWKNSAYEILFLILSHCLSLPEDQRNLDSALELLRNGFDNAQDIFNNIHCEDKYEKTFQKYSGNYCLLAKDTQKDLLTYITAKLQSFDNFKTSRNIDFNILNEEKKAIIIPMNPFSYDNRIVSIENIVISQIMHMRLKMYKDEPKCKPSSIRFILDEFSGYGSEIIRFADMIAISHSINISYDIILQSIYQLKTMFPNDYQFIIGNMSDYICMGAASTDDAFFVSELASKTMKNNSENIITPETIWRMPSHMCLVIAEYIGVHFDEKYVK